MAQPEPIEKATVGAMHDGAASGQLHAQLVQRQLAIEYQALAHPCAMRIQLAAAQVTLPSGRERSGLALQDHQIVRETPRHPAMPRSLPMAMAFRDIRDDTTTQRDRM
ncbi:transposase [Sinorhizobium fredii]|uniref:transposase n=1 Tax=Rhizobium fredii TaxID=380 RepID=UPI001F47E42C|nr:transposase [Sinorhizobium fredii]